MNADDTDRFETEDDTALTDKGQASNVKPPPEPQPTPTPLALVMGRLGVTDTTKVMIGKIASPRDEEDDKRFFAWIRVTHGLVTEIDEFEAEALRVAGTEMGEVPRCPACGEMAQYESPIGLQRDAWTCADDSVFVYAQGGVHRDADGSSAPIDS